MKQKKIIIIVAFLSTFVFSGCAQIIPSLVIRDDYWAKRILQPNRVSLEIKRDQLGNAILPTEDQ